MKHKYLALSGFALLLLAASVQAQFFTGIDLGGPGQAGSVVTNGDGSLTVSGGGGDIWNSADQFYFFYAWATGQQWEAKVQITDLQGPDNWSKGELMVRWSDPATGPRADDAFICSMSTRAAGQNELGDQFRSRRASGADWVELAPVWRPTYPNQWLRLTRTNNDFGVWFSADGLTWSNYLTITTTNAGLVSGSLFGQTWPDTLTVGLAVTAHNNANLGQATFQNLSVSFPPVTAPTVVGASRQVQNVSAYAGSEASFSFVTTNNAQPPVVNWPSYVSYQWYKNGSAIANATSTSYTRLVNPSDATENGAQYYCQATVLPPYNTSVSGLTSATGTVTVLPGSLYYTNGLKQEFLQGVGRVAVERGNTPAATRYVVDSIMDNPGNLGNNYVTRDSGWFIPPTSDYYVFFLACDDDSDLFLSTDGNPANKQLIAQEPAWSAQRSWLASGGNNAIEAMQKRSDQWSPDNGTTTPYSGGIQLSAGVPYYIELVHGQGGGGDNFAMTWQTTNEIADPNWSTTFTNGSPTRMTNGTLVLITGPTTTLTWSAQPTNTSVSQGGSTSFRARAATDSELNPYYQWYRNGSAIPGATSSSVSTGITTPADNGSTFFVVASTEEGGLSITSSVATLTVISAVLERGVANVEFYSGGNRTSVEANAAGAPTYVTTSPAFEASLNGETGDGYGRRISGYFFPPTTDNYVFFINGDDDVDMFVSTDATPANKRMVAQEPNWNNSLQWVGDNGNATANTQKRSDTWSPDGGVTVPYSTGIHLNGGQQYYVEIVHHEGGGGDNVAATYKRLNAGDPDPWNGMDSRFQGNVIGTYAPRCTYVAFTQQPTNLTVAPSYNGSITFRAAGTTDSQTPVGITGDVRPLVGNWSYVLYQWQKNGVNIPGATSSTLTISGPILPSDSGASFVCRIRALGYADNSLNPIWSNSTPATLTVTPAIPLVYEPGVVLVQHWNTNRTGGNASRGDVESGNVSNPAWLSTSTEFAVSTNGESGANYSRRLAGYFTPPATDDYVFWITSDDDSDLFLSTDASPLSKKLIARENSWSGVFTWNTDNGGGTIANKRSDQFSDWATGLNNGFAGIHLVGGQRYYMEAVHHEGGGGDNVEVNYSTISSGPPADGTDTLLKGNVIGVQVPVSHVAITNQPQNLTVPNYSPATFTIGASTDSQISFGQPGDIRNFINNFINYQWYKNGSAIAGATARSYTLPFPLPSDNGSQFYCAIRSLGLADGTGTPIWSNSANATLTVVTNTPHLLYAAIYTNSNIAIFSGSVTTYVTLSFDSPMDPVLLSQPSTYTLGGGLTIQSIMINSNDYRSVVLVVSGTPTFPFSVAINSNVSGYGGGAHVANTSINVRQVPLLNADIGTPGSDPAWPGQMIADGANAYTIMCEGSDIWNNADGFNFTYEPKTNDFDVVVRQKDIRHTSNWGKGGLMVRETIDAGSRNWNIVNDPNASDGIMAPDGSGLGASSIECNARVATAGASANWDVNRGPAPAYPNAWVRLTRRGNILTAYWSADGQHWTQAATADPTTVGDNTALPSVVYVGMSTTAHNNDPVSNPPLSPDQLTYLQVVHYADYNSTYIPPSTLSVTTSGNNVIVSWVPTVGHLEASPAIAGPGVDWQAVPGGTTSPVTLPIGTGSRFFRVVNP